MIGKPDLVVVGSYVQDHAWLTRRFPVTGETCLADGFNTGPGGKGFNQAVAAQRQGARVLFVGAVGDDHLGRVAQAFAREEALSCRWQVTADAPTAASSIVIDHTGSNRIVVSLGANERIDPAWLRGLADVMQGSGIMLLQLENNLDAIEAAVALGRELGMRIVLNPAPAHPRLDLELLRRIDLLTPNESEFALLLERIAGTRIEPDRVASLSDDALHAGCRRLGVPTVVVTLGEHGCFVSHASDSPFGHGENDRYRVAGERVNAVDSTGAGDAFNGALVAVLARGVRTAAGSDASSATGLPARSDSAHGGTVFRDAVEHANRSAALSTETIGTAPAMPTLEQVLARFGG
jgi:ribokinase